MPEATLPEVDPRLAESEARYQAVIENASDMIQSVRPDGTFEFVNRAWHQKLGYTAEDLGSLIIWDIVHPESLEHCQRLFTAASRGETIDQLETTFVTKEGKPLPVEGSATSRLLDGKVIATHGFFRDISERLRAQELEERNAQLERERLARYLEKMAALGRLSAGLAHELNNPAAAAQRASTRLAESLAMRDRATRELNAMGLAPEHWNALELVHGEAQRQALAQSSLGPLEVSEREEAIEEWLTERGVKQAWDTAPGLVQAGVTEEVLEQLAAQIPSTALAAAADWLSESLTIRQLADVVARSSRRMSELVSAVKAYSYMDRAAEQVVDIHEGIENTLIILAHRLKNITIMRDFDRSLPPVRAFGSGLNQVWTNLLDNALDATNEKGTISIRTQRDDNHVAVVIGDDGHGISPEHLTCIFEPFFSTKPQGQGTGLGLDTAWRIVTEEHHGEISVTSEPGKTEFRVLLPLVLSGDS